MIGAGSVLVKDIPANCIAAGNLCKEVFGIVSDTYDYYGCGQ